MQHHREDVDVTLECYLLPITLSPGLGCLLGTCNIQIWSKLRNRLRTITTLVIVGQKWIIMCPHVVQAWITTTVCTLNIWTWIHKSNKCLIIPNGNCTPGRPEWLRSVLSCHSLGFLLSILCRAMLSCFCLGLLLLYSDEHAVSESAYARINAIYTVTWQRPHTPVSFECANCWLY